MAEFTQEQYQEFFDEFEKAYTRVKDNKGLSSRK